MVRIDRPSFERPEGMPEKPVQGKMGDRAVKKGGASQKEVDALLRAAQKPLPPLPTAKKMKALPPVPQSVKESPTGLNEMQPGKPVPEKTITERQEKKFVVVKRDGKEVLKHHSALSFTEKYFGMNVVKKGASALQSHDTSELAGNAIELRKALRNKNEAAIRAALRDTPKEHHAALFMMLGIKESDPQIQKALTEKSSKATLHALKHAVHEAVKHNDFQGAFNHLKNAMKDAVDALVQSLSDEQLKKFHAVSHHEADTFAAQQIEKRLTQMAVAELKAALRDESNAETANEPVHRVRNEFAREILDKAIPELSRDEQEKIGRMLPTYVKNPTLKTQH